MVTGGKIGGYSRFHLAIVLVQRDVVQAWDVPLAKALSSSYGLGYGVSPWQLYCPPPAGVLLLSLLECSICSTGAAGILVAEL